MPGGPGQRLVAVWCGRAAAIAGASPTAVTSGTGVTDTPAPREPPLTDGSRGNLPPPGGTAGEVPPASPSRDQHGRRAGTTGHGVRARRRPRGADRGRRPAEGGYRTGRVPDASARGVPDVRRRSAARLARRFASPRPAAASPRHQIVHRIRPRHPDISQRSCPRRARGARHAAVGSDDAQLDPALRSREAVDVTAVGRQSGHAAPTPIRVLTHGTLEVRLTTAGVAGVMSHRRRAQVTEPTTDPRGRQPLGRDESLPRVRCGAYLPAARRSPGHRHLDRTHHPVKYCADPMAPSTCTSTRDRCPTSSTRYRRTRWGGHPRRAAPDRSDRADRRSRRVC